MSEDVRPSAWVSPAEGGSVVTKYQQTYDAVPLYTEAAAREMLARELEEEARNLCVDSTEEAYARRGLEFAARWLRRHTKEGTP